MKNNLKEKIKVMSDAVGLFAHSSDSVLHEYLPEAWKELKAELEEHPKAKYGQLYVAFDAYGKNTFIETNFPDLIEKYKKEKLWKKIVLCDLIEAELTDDCKHIYSDDELYEKFSRIFTVNKYKGGWEDPLDYYIFEADKRRECSTCDKQKPYTLTVEIPETVDGLCNMDCPFFVPNVVVNHCLLRLSAIADDFYCKPFKGCSRFSNEGDK